MYEYGKGYFAANSQSLHVLADLPFFMCDNLNRSNTIGPADSAEDALLWNIPAGSLDSPPVTE